MKKERTQTTLFVTCLILLTTIFPTASDAQNNGDATYYCTAEAAGGLHYNSANMKWEGTVFDEHTKFVLRFKFLRAWVEKESDNKEVAVTDYEITKTDAGSNVPNWCVTDIHKIQYPPAVTVTDSGGLVECEWGDAYEQFIFSSKDNRFLETNLYGYVNRGESNDDTPLVRGGTCTKSQ